MTNYDWLKQMDETRRQREITAWYNNAKIRYILYNFWEWLQEEHIEEVKPCPCCGGKAEIMKEKYKQVVDQFYKECLIRRISDEWLKKHDKDTRSSCEMTGEFRYGIVYLRDDAVEVLLDYIKELGGDV